MTARKVPTNWLPHELDAFRNGMRLRAQRFRDQKKERSRNACRQNLGRGKEAGALE